MKHRLQSFTAAFVILTVIAFCASPAAAQVTDNQPFQGGLVTTDYDDGTSTATVEMRIDAESDFTGGQVSNIQYTLRALDSEGVTFGNVTSSPFGLSKAEEGTYTVSGQTYTYAIYTGSNPVSQDFMSGTPVTMATFEVTGDKSDTIELTITEESGTDELGSDGRYYIAYDGTGYAHTGNTDSDAEFYTTDSSLEPGETHLPVEMGNFTGQADGQAAVLEWKTLSEKNNQGFYVEQKDGDTWTEVSDLIEGAGNSQTAQSYSHRVEDLDYGAHTFRLRQVDTDGTPTISDRQVEVSVQMDAAYALEGAYPNPFQERATFEFAVQETQSVTVELYNTLGQRVKVLHQGKVPGGQTQTLDLEADRLSSGMYFLQIRGKDFTASESVTLVR